MPLDAAHLPTPEEWDQLDENIMRHRGSLKWSGTGEQPICGHWVAEMDFGTSPAIANCLRDAISNGLLGYIPTWARTAAHEATAAFYRDHFNWDFPATDVTLVASVLDGLRAMLRTMIPAGSTVLVPTPAYMPFLTIPQSFEHQVQQIPSVLVDGQWELDFEALEAAAPQAQMLILCNPWNPTGRVLTEAELRQVEAIATRHGLVVFADEIHSPLVFGNRHHVAYAGLSEAAAAHTVTAVSGSKGFNIAGLQCAQVIVTDPQLRKQWENAATRAAHPGTLGVLAVPAAYQQSQAWLAQVLGYLEANLQLIDEMLTGSALSWTRPQATYLGWIDASALGERPAQRVLEETGVQVNCGSTLGSGYDQYLRFNFASSRQVVQRSLEAILALTK